MEQYVLYLILKNIIKDFDSNFKCTFNDMDFNKPYSCGIYVKGSDISKYRDIAKGNYYNYIARVQFILQGDTTGESLQSVLRLASKIRNSVPTYINNIYNLQQSINMDINNNIIINNDYTIDNEDTSNISLMLLMVRLLGEVNFIGKTTQGLPRYTINFNISYNITRR